MLVSRLVHIMVWFCPTYQSPVVGDGDGAVLTLAGPCGGRPVRILRLVGQAPVVVPVHPLVVPVGATPITAIASNPVGTVQHVLLAQVGRENTSGLLEKCTKPSNLYFYPLIGPYPDQ